MADEAERRWLDEVYRPDLPQLTPRAILTGMVLGAVMCCSNLYIVLKTGWSVGVTITACIVAYAFWSGMRSFGAREFSILENNTMSSVASAAGYMTGGGNMAAIPALLMLTGLRPDSVSAIVWLAIIATLGVFTAIPIKRQLINKEQLAFPMGSATGATLRALHVHAEVGREKARLLAWAALIGEVASESIRKDRNVKARVYARAGIPEYWIADVDNQRVEVNTDPDAGAERYRSQVVMQRGQSVAPQAFPALQLAVAPLFA